MSLPDPEVVARLLREVAAQEVMPRFDNLAKSEIREKGPGNLVTIADTEAERWLAPHLLGLAPGSFAVGEEAVATDPARLDDLVENELVWLIDPIDGTANFAAARPIFAVMVALVRRGRTVMAWIFDPIGDRMLVAVEGEGAWRNGERMRVAPSAPLARMSGRLGRRFLPRAHAAGITEIFNLRCAGHEYARLAEGVAHFGLYFGKLWPWDHAPGTLIHREAGGYGALLDGGPYRPRFIEGSLLLAPDRDGWEALRRTLADEA